MFVVMFVFLCVCVFVLIFFFFLDFFFFDLRLLYLKCILMKKIPCFSWKKRFFYI